MRMCRVALKLKAFKNSRYITTIYFVNTWRWAQLHYSTHGADRVKKQIPFDGIRDEFPIISPVKDDKTMCSLPSCRRCCLLVFDSGSVACMYVHVSRLLNTRSIVSLTSL